MQGNYLRNLNGAGEGVETYFTFSFKYEFEARQDDEVYFAHAVPATYTEMQSRLKEKLDDPQFSSFLKADVLCLSLAKNPVPLLTITENVSTHLDYVEEVKLRDFIPPLTKRMLRQKYRNSRKLLKQIEESNG